MKNSINMIVQGEALMAEALKNKCTDTMAKAEAILAEASIRDRVEAKASNKRISAEALINSTLQKQIARGDHPIKLTKLFTSNNPKILKSLKQGYQTIGLSLAPASINGIVNLCTSASKECLTDCLNLSGRGVMNQAQTARKRKALELINDPLSFLTQLCAEIAKAEAKAIKADLILVIRLNVLSDLQWEKIKLEGDRSIFDLFPHIQFYDYSKHDLSKRSLPDNYSVTFSYTGHNKKKAEKLIGLGHTIAVVFNHKRISMPDLFLGHKTASGDDHDLVFIHPRSTVLMLTAKGKALKAIGSPFVIGS